jgi:hypothetical protein
MASGTPALQNVQSGEKSDPDNQGPSESSTSIKDCVRHV